MVKPKSKSTGSVKDKMPARKKIVFKIEAPAACDVYVAGDFNDWDRTSHPLKCNAKGVWNASITLCPGKHEYRFLIDGQWQNDPNCKVFVPNAFGSYNCAILLE